MSDPTPAESRRPFIPLLLFAAALLVWSAFQSWQLFIEHDALGTLKAAQAQPLERSRQLRTELDTIARNTQRLADAGNASARLIVEELRKRGITINLDASAPQPPR